MPHRILLTGNFALEPIYESLRFWLGKLQIGMEIRLSAFDQIFQVLLNILSTQSDYVVILLRLSRWAIARAIDSSDGERSVVDDFATTLESAARQSGSRFIVLLCPCHDFADAAALLAMENALVAAVAHPAVEIMRSTQIAGVYTWCPPGAVYNRDPGSLEDIPYTRLGYATLGTVVARRLFSCYYPSKKVIVVDCDNTLWEGRVGEDGPIGVRIHSCFHEFQKFLVKQSEGGRLICICSKNDERNVMEVFRSNQGMILRIGQVAAWKVNWERKSSNLLAISRELSLSTDTFIFVDDDPVECAEVRASLPEVLTVEFPKRAEHLKSKLENIWEFDLRTPTAADASRTTYYLKEIERTAARARAPSLSEFIADLNVVVTIGPLKIERVGRATQVLDRTTQFTLNDRRPSEGYLALALENDFPLVLTVDVRDRFGDYGLVGIIMYRMEVSMLLVDAFALSCRALGRGVEAQMALELAAIAERHGLDVVHFSFSFTGKNVPMQKFLEEICESEGVPHFSSTSLALGAKALARTPF